MYLQSFFMLLPDGRNELSESENVSSIASLVIEEVRHTWQGQMQTKMSKDWVEGLQNSKEKMVLRLSQVQRVRQVEDKASLLWRELSFLLLSSDFKVYLTTLISISDKTPLNNTSEPNFTAIPQAFVIP